jgi:ligand-binding SRPBCC domain-containing protein
MPVYQLKSHQKLPISLQEAWDFLSSPYNLNEITPQDMDFEITNGIQKTDKMFAGQIIVYKLKPLPFYKTEWVTEITHVSEGNYFIDEQRFGPYAFWHHQHHLKEIKNGVEMSDTVHYKIPFGFVGSIANALFIRNKLKQIFDYRHKKLIEIFGDFH